MRFRYFYGVIERNANILFHAVKIKHFLIKGGQCSIIGSSECVRIEMEISALLLRLIT
jgi:hypothetical protein